jgi:hypothetical protein
MMNKSLFTGDLLTFLQLHPMTRTHEQYQDRLEAADEDALPVADIINDENN